MLCGIMQHGEKCSKDMLCGIMQHGEKCSKACFALSCVSFAYR
uniref:Uncharacterized protein n=1 Tax=Anguilla anguilla TaxID=7936 RepID=A0A0E9U2Z5_ANGAN